MKKSKVAKDLGELAGNHPEYFHVTREAITLIDDLSFRIKDLEEELKGYRKITSHWIDLAMSFDNELKKHNPQ